MVEKFPTPLKGVPLGELAANVVSRLRGIPAASLQMPFPATTPPAKK